MQQFWPFIENAEGANTKQHIICLNPNGCQYYVSTKTHVIFWKSEFYCDYSSLFVIVYRINVLNESICIGEWDWFLWHRNERDELTIRLLTELSYAKMRTYSWCNNQFQAFSLDTNKPAEGVHSIWRTKWKSVAFILFNAGKKRVVDYRKMRHAYMSWWNTTSLCTFILRAFFSLVQCKNNNDRESPVVITYYTNDSLPPPFSH